MIVCAALVVFASSCRAKSFEDEYAYITQSYYADLFFAGQLTTSSGSSGLRPICSRCPSI